MDYPFLSRRIRSLAESQTIGMSKRSRELAATGADVIDLSLGEPDFVTPAHIREAAKKAIDEGYTFYPPIAGFADLREAISNKFKRENQLDYAPDQVVVSTGAKQSIANTVLCLVNPGDEVIIPLPYWVSYLEIVKLAEGITVPLKGKLENKYKITPEDLEKAITPKTKLFIFSSPCNPTGSVYSRDELKALADVFEKHPQVFILSDEIYEHISFTGKHQSFGQFEALRDRLIIVNGVSKGYAMTGWRIGYIGAPKEIAAACDKMQGQITSGASSISQKASVAALNMTNEPTVQMREAFRRRRDLVYNLMKEIPGMVLHLPEGAFYMFPKINSWFGKANGTFRVENATDLCMYLLNFSHVSLVTGEAFGDPECLRLSYATSDDKLVEAIKRIKNGLAALT
ncbi:MAG: pyridoxal phosphate-dependent aminotransferase [Bacteroidia bacterium]|nr:pyridoxal phosphate-dependent aminotransferase [Bacteroidia bacterium]